MGTRLMGNSQSARPAASHFAPVFPAPTDLTNHPLGPWGCKYRDIFLHVNIQSFSRQQMFSFYHRVKEENHCDFVHSLTHARVRVKCSGEGKVTLLLLPWKDPESAYHAESERSLLPPPPWHDPWPSAESECPFFGGSSSGPSFCWP